MLLEIGSITEDEFDKRESALLDRLDALENRESDQEEQRQITVILLVQPSRFLRGEARAADMPASRCEIPALLRRYQLRSDLSRHIENRLATAFTKEMLVR